MDSNGSWVFVGYSGGCLPVQDPNGLLLMTAWTSRRSPWLQRDRSLHRDGAVAAEGRSVPDRWHGVEAGEAGNVDIARRPTPAPRPQRVVRSGRRRR